jgi:hypothetical protein
MWKKFTEERPKLGTYWFRVGPIESGITCTPEWMDEVASHGMGYAEDQPWPRFSNWNGYVRTIHKGTEWKPLGENDVVPKYGIQEKSLRFPDVELLPCPFCGRQPKFGYQGRWIGAAPFQAEYYSLRCCRVELGRGTVGELQKSWNTRAS